MNKKVLLVGESWTSTTMEVKGFNSFLSSKYETGLGWIDHAIEAAGYELVYMPNHLAAEEFPFTADKLQDYSCVILSDVGADTLLIPPKTFSSSQKFPNRCQLIKDYVLCCNNINNEECYLCSDDVRYFASESYSGNTTFYENSRHTWLSDDLMYSLNNKYFNEFPEEERKQVESLFRQSFGIKTFTNKSFFSDVVIANKKVLYERLVDKTLLSDFISYLKRDEEDIPGKRLQLL